MEPVIKASIDKSGIKREGNVGGSCRKAKVKLSYRMLQEMMYERGLKVAHTTIMR
ncbi:hypothetical protein Ga0466249_005128 [Sporomusaceae bacterium BoRhaA]|uniref:hypothetical protein n=1 Tax=Pelorhabdus rhamnosifermentans TaxID=2772457 RepID=UPI001C05F87A|nr:hypothetical protein [Pelorhabdus rhamnosifermentans]MBU2703976.1 hypothetical protein [Pelorhabdus rhamnosifermentans]